MDHSNSIIYDPREKLKARAGHISRRFRKTHKVHDRERIYSDDSPALRLEHGNGKRRNEPPVVLVLSNDWEENCA